MNNRLILDGLPVIHNAGEDRAKTNTRFFKAMHNHPNSTEILLTTEGNGFYNIDGVTHEVKPQSIIVYNKGVWHEEKSDAQTIIKYVAFSNIKIQGLPDDFLIHREKNPVFQTGDFFTFKQLFEEIIQENNSNKVESQWIARHLVGVLIGKIMRTLSNKETVHKQSNGHKIVEETKHYIQENYHQNIKLGDLAQVVYVSPYYLSHLFKKMTKTSPIQYLIQYRIEVAKHLLLTTNLTITEIAIKVGYQSETHFQNTFKKIAGVTPGQYRIEF